MRPVVTLLLVIMLFGSSCALMGGKHATALSDKKIEQYAKKYNIDRFNIYKLDTGYAQLLTVMKTMPYSSSTAQNMSLPIQYLLFDKNGRLLSHVVDNWDAGGFNFFPPHSADPIDTSITLSILKPYFMALQEPKDNKGTIYSCVIFWNRFNGKQSKALVTTALKNLQEYTSDRTVALYFVNDDNFFSKR
jgi:hypothetical protein